MRMRQVHLLFLLGLLFQLQPGKAQQNPLSNLRQKSIPITSSPLLLDSFTIVQSTFSIAGVDSTFYKIEHNEIAWLKPLDPNLDSVEVTYRVLPYNLGEAIQRINGDTIRNVADQTVVGYVYNPFEDSEKLIDFQGLQYNGSFSRGISFGNNQDLVLNSNFNLQLGGKLGNDVEILAAITDENIPLQPEGNTQQLREFDKIYVQIRKANHLLTAGDYEIRRPKGYFMNYFKKLQGATWQGDFDLGESQLKSQVSVAVSRGKFARNNLAQQEGNQGPYRLQGNENERFIIVLAGSEKVWIDGVLMKRGIDGDYIMDYNRGEITFTSRRLITKDSRIIIEFEYSDLNFNRTLMATNHSYQKNNWQINFNVYSEQDGKNSSGNQTLTNGQKQLLSEAGDSFQNTLVSSIDAYDDSDFANLRVGYQLLDTTTSCGIFDTLLVYVPDAESATVSARFTFVGQGNGNYILDTENIANERIYRWVAPDSITCQPRGDYDAVTQLIAPKQKQLYTLGANYTFNDKSGQLLVEGAISNNNLNRFSRINQNDNLGTAFTAQFDKLFNLSGEEKGWKMGNQVKYEYTQQNFQALNPYRNPEFLRDWNLSNVLGVGQVQNADEHLINSSIWIEKNETTKLSYQFNTFLRGTLYQGIKQAGQFQLNSKGWLIDILWDELKTDEKYQATSFQRPAFQLSKSFEKLANWVLGVKGQREKSRRFDLNTDTLTNASFYFDQWSAFLKSPTENKFGLQLQYDHREDFSPTGDRFSLNAIADNFSANSNFGIQRWLQVTTNLTYRNLTIKGPTTNLPNNPQTGATVLGRIDLNLNLAKGAIRLTNNYEIGSGQEPKLEFSFVKVQQGQGTHIWLDSLYNHDGIIQPNEMEIAPFPDQADYIKVSTFTNEFIQTNNVILNQSLQLNPKAIWFKETGIKKLLSHLATQNTLKINRKTQPSAAVDPWNPYDLEVIDTSLVAVSASIRHLLFINRGSPIFDVQLGQSDNRSKLLQTTGFESRQRTEWFVKSRYNLSSVLTARVSYARANRLSDSEFFDNRDYRIISNNFGPDINYLISKNLRVSASYGYESSANIQSESPENLLSNQFKLEATFNQSAKTSLRSQFSLVQIKFEGIPNSPVGFVLLNGLQPGKNLLWNISIDRQIAKNIRLNLSYDGRQTGDNKVIHVGRAQVAAVF